MIYYPVVFVKKMMYLTLPHEFFPENYRNFLSNYSKEHQWAAVSVLALLLSSDNLLTGFDWTPYEQLLSYSKFNQNLWTCDL